MNALARAGIDIYGTVLRYAEVEQRGSRYNLLRLGSCDFDFDVIRAVQEGRNREYLETILEALEDVFDGSIASRLHVTLHPPACYSFFSPLPVDLPSEQRKQHFEQELALLAPSDSVLPLRLAADPVYTEALEEGETVEWFHVMALQESLHARFDRMFRMLPHLDYRMAPSMQAVAHAVERIERQADEADFRRGPFTLVIGWYPTHVEYTLCRHSRWFFSHFTEATSPQDCVYFALVLLRRLGLQRTNIGRIFVYGHHHTFEDFTSLRSAFDVVPERLNPMQLVDLDPQSMAARFDAEEYAACIGGTL